MWPTHRRLENMSLNSRFIFSNANTTDLRSFEATSMSNAPQRNRQRVTIPIIDLVFVAEEMECIKYMKIVNLADSWIEIQLKFCTWPFSGSASLHIGCTTFDGVAARTDSYVRIVIKYTIISSIHGVVPGANQQTTPIQSICRTEARKLM